MAVLVLGAVGYSLGAGMAAGFLGTALGVAGGYIGSRIGGAVDRALGIGPSRSVEGPRLGDMDVQSSAYGRPLPLVYGQARVAGNVIWSTGLEERRSENRQGGGKGGSVTQVTYSYSASFAVAVSGRPIHGVGRIWADGKLLRGASGNLAVGGAMRVHTGHEGQMPDPLIEARQGMGQTPAYRGTAYVMFEGLELAEYANRIPNLSFEVIADPGGTVAVGDVIADLSFRAGIGAGVDNVDVSALDDLAPVDGFVIGRSVVWRDALEALSRAYPFDAAEVDGRIVFAPLPRGPALSIDGGDLLPDGDNRRALERTRAEDASLPAQVVVRHMDPARDYQPGVQRARRAAAAAADRGGEEMELPLVLDASRAKQAAEVALARAWGARERVTFSLPMRYVLLAAGDVVSLDPLSGVMGGAPGDGPDDAPPAPSVKVQIEEVESGSGRIQCRGAVFDAAVFASAAAGDAGLFPPQTVAPVADTVLRLLDLPPLSDAAAGRPVLYAAAAGEGPEWRGAVVFRAEDDGNDEAGGVYEEITRIGLPAVMGVTDDALPPGPWNVWDRASNLTVTLLNADMSLESRPELAVLNGANAALVGDEIIQFRSATQIGATPLGAGQYRLTHLLRGRRGTEQAVEGHAAGEPFTLLTPAGIAVLEPGLSAVLRVAHWKGVSVGQAVDGVDAQAHTFTARNLKPFAPVHLRGRRDASGDLSITWIRRTRAPGDWISGADVPLAEETERYEVDILDGDAVVRTFDVTTPEVIYTVADQAADFGAPPASLTVAITQISAAVGRGTSALAVL